MRLSLVGLDVAAEPLIEEPWVFARSVDEDDVDGGEFGVPPDDGLPRKERRGLLGTPC